MHVHIKMIFFWFNLVFVCVLMQLFRLSFRLWFCVGTTLGLRTMDGFVERIFLPDVEKRKLNA